MRFEPGSILAQGLRPRCDPKAPMACAVSEQVHNHFRKYEVEYLQFAFRWMNNLLMRELPLRCTIRLWDTYQVRHTQLPTLPLFTLVWASSTAVPQGPGICSPVLLWK